MRAVFTHEFTLGNLSVSEEPIWRTRRTADDVRAWKAKFYARKRLFYKYVATLILVRGKVVFAHELPVGFS